MHLSKEEKIEILKKRVENFKSDLLNPTSMIHSLYKTNSPKKDLFRHWGETLEALHELGEYKDDVSTISTHITRQLKEMGLPKAVEWAREILPNKYKDSAKVHASILLAEEFKEFRRVQPAGTFKSKEEITAENKIYIDETDKDIAVLEAFKQKLFTTEFVSKLDLHELDEFFTHKRQTRKHLLDVIDHRNKVQPSKQHILLHAFTEATMNDTFTKYILHLRNLLTATHKQTEKIVTGRVSKTELLYNPDNQEQARHAGFYGTKCPECGSWRVDKKYNTNNDTNMLFCYACKEWGPIKIEPLVPKLV